MKRLSFAFPTEVVAEGGVKVVVPKLRAFLKKPSDYAPSKAPVFYNPMMEVNRDLAVLALQTFHQLVGRMLRVCEPLAGCGIRGVRLATEVDGVGKVILNDISSEAFRLTKFNIKKNGLVKKVLIENEDANLLLSRFAAPRKRFDYVDIDPFGSPMPYVDSAIRATRSSGMFALTATDLAPLCGVHPRACVRKYGGKPLRTGYCHELAIRLLAGALAKSAAIHDVGINVLFSYSSKHYIRLYATVDYGAKEADTSLKNLGFVNHCFSCLHRNVLPGKLPRSQMVCPKCGSKTSRAGPLWIDEIANKDFITSMEKQARNNAFRHKKEIRKLLGLMKEEAEAPITYYSVDKICDKFGLPVPPVKKIISALEKIGYEINLTHFTDRGFKTNAPAKIIKEVITKLKH